MAMSAATLKAAMKASLISLLGSWESVELDDLQDSNYAFQVWADKVAEAISSTVVAHIKSAARCNGNDSRGDSHENVGII
jgi:hypothetical protein